MSLEQGDINNDGAPEFFASDMMPYHGEAMEPWEPMMMEMMDEPPQTYDPANCMTRRSWKMSCNSGNRRGAYFNLSDAGHQRNGLELVGAVWRS